MHPDLRAYVHFTGKSRFEKSVNSLLGLLEGILHENDFHDPVLDA